MSTSVKNWISAVVGSAMIALLVGCGGTGGADPIGGGPGGSGGGALLSDVGTAQLNVNVKTGQVQVVPIGMPGDKQTRSLFSGSAISVSSSPLATDTSDLTLKTLK